MAKYPKAPKVITAKPGGTYANEFEEVAEERRIKNVEAARSVYNRMLTDNTLRSATFARIRNQLEGGRPFDPELLAEQGNAWQTNVNFGDSEAARDRTMMPYWKMVNDVPHRIAVTVQTQSPHSELWAAAFAQCFDEFLDDWGSDYKIQFLNLSKNFVDFGPGIPHFQDQDSARWKSANVQRVLWPKNTRMEPEAWDVWAMVSDMSPSDLYKKVRTKKISAQSKFAGWNPEAIKKTICIFKDGNMPDPKDYTRWQDILVNNDIATSTPYEPIPVIWLFVKQFSGKIGCYVFTLSGVEEFLFESDNYAEDPRHIISPIWYDTGTDSMIHSIKGFAVKNYYFSHLLNGTKSRVVDGATIALGLNFQRAEGNVPDESPPVENYGPVTIFPPGMSQLNIAPNFQAGMGVIGMLENNQATNNALYREQQQQIEQTDTATQAKILAAMQNETSAASASIYLSQMADLFGEQMRRLRRKGNTDKDAVEFVKRMKELQVPEDVIHDVRIRVKTGANAGLANPAMRAMKFQQGLALGNIPGVNQRWFLENFIANEYGAAAVDKALLPEGQMGDPTQINQATVENNMFGQGQPMQVIPQDNHFLHLQVHLEPLKGVAGAAQSGQQLTPEQMTALAIGVQHASVHMDYLSKDDTMKQQFMEIRPLFSQIQSVTRGLLMRQAQQQQQMQPTG